MSEDLFRPHGATSAPFRRTYPCALILLLRQFYEARRFGLTSLRWQPVRVQTAAGDVRAVSDFTQWCADNFGHVPANPTETKLVSNMGLGELKAHELKFTARKNWDKLFHLSPASQEGWAAADSVVIGGVRFLGTTLWPDFGIPVHPGKLTLAMAPYEGINHKGQVIPYAALLWHHNCAVAWLTKRLAQPFKGPTVVVSHHAPHPKSAACQGPGDSLAQANQTRLTGLMGSAALWLHGGVRAVCDYSIKGTRIVSNPVGSPADRRYPFSVAQGSNRYDPDQVIEVGKQ